jgi:serine/threonine protein phosphatase PrpC
VRIREAVAATHKGNRSHNEDAVLRQPRVPLFGIADGMGGPGAGDLAAGLALDMLKRHADELTAANERVAESRSTDDRLALGRLVDQMLNLASREVQREAARLQRPGMGTTLVLAMVIRNYGYIAHVGDSRAYLYRDGSLSRLTEDHTIAELHFRRGRITREEYDKSPDRRVLYQCLGAGVEVDGDLAEVRLTGGDVLMLCSDGLPRALSDAAIAEIIAPADLATSCDRLVAAAVAHDAPDNLSVVMLGLEDEPGDEPITAVTDVMRDVFLFKGMSAPELLTIAPYLEEVVVDTGATVVSETEAAPGFYVVVSGAVRTMRGKTPILDVKAGGHFGELALARQGTRSATVRALAPTRLFLLTSDRFRELLRQKPELGARLALALVDAVGRRLEDLSERLAAVERAARGELR